MKQIPTAAFLGAALIAIGALFLIDALGVADVGAVLVWTPSLFIALASGGWSRAAFGGYSDPR